MIESSIAWSPDGRHRAGPRRESLAAVTGAIPYKARTEYDASAFDAWEFYRFKKTIK